MLPQEFVEQGEKQCIHQLEKVDNKQISVGLGELITPSQKDWARENLREEVIALLELRR